MAAWTIFANGKLNQYNHAKYSAEQQVVMFENIEAISEYRRQDHCALGAEGVEVIAKFRKSYRELWEFCSDVSKNKLKSDDVSSIPTVKNKIIAADGSLTMDPEIVVEQYYTMCKRASVDLVDLLSFLGKKIKLPDKY